MTPGTYVIEHKTASDDIGIGSTYWQKLTLDAQVSNYLVGARSLGHEPAGVLYDVLKKPDLEPYEATPIEKRKYVQESSKACPACKLKGGAETAPHRVILSKETGGGNYAEATCSGGRVVTEPGGRLYANQRDRDETPEEYRDRCLADIAAKPDAYYQRGVIVRLESEERDAAFDMWMVAEAIRNSRNANRWPRNVDSCSQYHRMCDYWSVCSGQTVIEDGSQFTREGTHTELDGKHHLPMLTTSSARSYRACSKRYYFAYELGAKARQRGAALAFGTLIHKALETWLQHGLDAALAAIAPEVYTHDDAKAEAMIRGYDARWGGEALDVIAVEKEFVAKLINPDTGASSRTWVMAGKLDGLVAKL